MKTIEIERTKEVAERSWRAVVMLPRTLDIVGHGVCGNWTEDGPWVEGFGATPEGALRAAYSVIGQAVVHSQPRQASEDREGAGS